MVSHDQHLIESTVDELWAVEQGTGAALLVAPLTSAFKHQATGLAPGIWVLQAADVIGIRDLPQGGVSAEALAPDRQALHVSSCMQLQRLPVL